ncbi:MAG: DUF2608 domain-containing protein [Alphaproteobacteria bacterium]|jgi:hypothetical protein|nr:DUF2608 domain-containing protein [Alphaproteobacteria bacterium]
MKKLFLAFLSLTGLSPMVGAKALHQEARTALDIHRILSPLLQSHRPQKILVLFDIDMTLTQTDHPAIHYTNLKKHSVVFKNFMKSLTPLARDETLSATAYMPQKLTDSAFPTLIKDLQDQGILCLALTSRLVGPLRAADTPLEQQTYHTLKGFNIDFERGWHFKEKDHFDLSQVLSVAYRGHFPTYYKGILVNNGERGPYEKVDTLLAFLEYAFRVRPTVIVLVDDKKENLDPMAKTLSARNKVFPKKPPLFIGVHYKGSEDLEAPAVDETEIGEFWQRCVKRAQS